MRFTEHLQAHLTPEWRTQYIDYEGLRDVIVRMAEKAPEGDSRNYYDDCDVSFFEIWQPELLKIDNFFEEKLAEARRKFLTLKEELSDYQEQLSNRQSVWQSLTALASTGGDRSRKSKQFQQLVIFEEEEDFTTRESNRERVRQANLEMVSEKESNAPNSVIGGLTKRISTANFHQVIQRTQERRQEIRREKKQVRKLHDIKLGFSEFYLSLVLLQNYQTLNFTGFRKLFKKHDKLFGRTTGAQWLSLHVERAGFFVNKEVDQLIVKVETLYTKELEEGDRGRAMKRLRVPPLSEKQNPWTTFRAGFVFGVFTVQLLLLLLLGLFHRPLPDVWVPAVRIFRSTFLLALFVLLIGVNTFGWQAAGVNHVLIFEIDPRHHLTHQDYMEVAGVLLVTWAAAGVYFLMASTLAAPSYLGPFLLVLIFALFLFNPFRFAHYKARRWLLRILKRIFLAPFYPVSFADFWLADQLNSLGIVFVDCVFCVCFFSCQMNWLTFQPLAAAATANATASTAHEDGTLAPKGGFCSTEIYGLVSIVRCLPAWFRLAQCLRRYYDMEVRAPFPHLVNAGKYSCTFFVVIFSVLSRVVLPDSRVCLALCLLAMVAKTVYTYAWDILMDWGLFDVNEPSLGAKGRCNHRAMLRDELVYRRHIVYYVAIVEDLVLRLSWVVTVVLMHLQIGHSELVTCVLSLGEVLRRFVWNFFRLENEHLNNCGQFRAVRDICIAPIPSRGGSGVSSAVKRSQAGGGQAWPTPELAPCRQHSAETPSRYRARGHMFGSRSSLDRATYMQPVNASDGAREALVVVDNCGSPTSDLEKLSSRSSTVPVKFQLQEDC